MASMGFKPDLFVTDAMFSVFTQVTCCISWPLKERLKPGPKSVALIGFKPDLFVTDAMFSLFSQVTCCIRGPLKDRLKPGPKSVVSMGFKPRPLRYRCDVLPFYSGDMLYKNAT